MSWLKMNAYDNPANKKYKMCIPMSVITTRETSCRGIYSRGHADIFGTGDEVVSYNEAGRIAGKCAII